MLCQRKPIDVRSDSTENKLLTALNSIQNSSIVNLSVGLGDNLKVWEAVARCLKRGNIIFLAIDNNGKKLGTKQDYMGQFLQWLKSQNIVPEVLTGLHLTSRVRASAELALTESTPSSSTIVAVMNHTTCSQEFGESSVEGDLADFAQSLGSAAAGSYDDREGTSFSAPAQAGGMAQVIYYLMVEKKMSWPDAKEKAEELFQKALRKKNIHFMFNENDNLKIKTLEGDPLDRSSYGRGIYDHENLLMLASTEKEKERGELSDYNSNSTFRSNAG